MHLLVGLAVFITLLVPDLTAIYQRPRWLLQHNATIRTELQKYAAVLAETHQNVEAFPCQVMSPSPTVPTSVHRLRPADIKVVAALGDSLTAGKGISTSNIFGLLVDDRGLAFSIGGDATFEEHVTLPNILKKYNPDIKGFSVKTGNRDNKNSHLNVAKSGAESDELAGQANLLVERLKSEEGVDFDNDWKVITILIGGNDLCKSCEDGAKYSADEYMTHLQSALDILHKNVPRAFVNLVEPLNMEVMKSLNKGLVCSILHQIGCKCAAFPKDDKAEETLTALTKEYQSRVYQLVDSGRYDTNDDFTVVVQPFLHDTYLPMKDGKPDMSYFAPDCFHFREKGHHELTKALWNNMLEALSKKKTKWQITEPFECPTEQDPYFGTYKNSASFSKSESGKNQVNKDKSQVGTEEAVDDRNADKGDKRDGLNTSEAGIIASVFLVVLVGIVLTALWTRRRRGHNVYQKIMTKDELLWDHSPRNHLLSH